MTRRFDPDELLDFPCDYEFKAFGQADREQSFLNAVQEAVGRTVPVSRHALRIRHSSGGKYLCVTVLVRLHNSDQLKTIYQSLRQVEDLKYLL